MNIKLINKLRDSINFFDDAEFISLISENVVLIKNSKTGSEWQVPFIINESGKIIFKGTEAECVKEADEENSEEIQYKKNVKAIIESISTIFEDVDTGVESLSKLIRSVPYLEKQKEAPIEPNEKQEFKYFLEFKDKIAEFDEIFQDFMENGKMFDGDGDIRVCDFIEASYYKEAYESKLKLSKAFLEKAEVFNEFKEMLEKEFESDVVKIIIESIDFSQPKNKFETLLTKNLVSFKNNVDSGIDILEITKKAANYFESTLGKIENEELILEGNLDLKEDYYSNRFTRFNIGIFKREDLVKINEELSAAMVSYEIDNPEDLAFINELKMKIEYMERTNQIDDELVVNILKDFNTRYGHDKSNIYRDENKGLGWKSPSRQKITSLDVAMN